MGELLALTSALCFGGAHFLNALVARRGHHGVVVAAYAQAAGTVVSVIVAVAVSTAADPVSLAWGALSGLGTGVGVGCLYWSMNSSPLSVVVPVSDVAAVTLPVLIGLAVLGERPSATALAGAAVAVPAIALVSRGKNGDGRTVMCKGIVLAAVAGVCFAVQYVAMARVPASAGWWPVAVSRAASVAAILALCAVLRPSMRLPAKGALVAGAGGVAGTAGIILYLLASHTQLLTVAVVLSALYPAVPVVLGLVLLRERLSAVQIIGLTCAAAAIALIAAG